MRARILRKAAGGRAGVYRKVKRGTLIDRSRREVTDERNRRRDVLVERARRRRHHRVVRKWTARAAFYEAKLNEIPERFTKKRRESPWSAKLDLARSMIG